LGDLSSDQCIIDPDRFFIRGSIEIPVVDGDGPFVWGVWVSLSETNFKRASDRWLDPNRMEEPAYFGWLCNSLPGYPETLSLKTSVHTRAAGIRPFVELEPTEHPLAVEQRDGITMARVIEIGEIAMHHNATVPSEEFGIDVAPAEPVHFLGAHAGGDREGVERLVRAVLGRFEETAGLVRIEEADLLCPRTSRHACA
jgi:hypothetical protein